MTDHRLHGISLLLRVDGKRIDPRHVTTHLQDDPYPGGHTWFASLSGPGAEDLLAGVHVNDAELGRARQGEILSVIEGIDTNWGTGPAEFVLNTVDNVSAENGHIRASGRCSPVVVA